MPANTACRQPELMCRSKPSFRQFDHVVAHRPKKIGIGASRTVPQDMVVILVNRAFLPCWDRARLGASWAHIAVDTEL